jgi:hypothetical protein
MTGATASLSWQPVMDPGVISYTVHYGKYSSGDPGSCSYDDSVDVYEPSAKITGLDFNTQYYFAVNAFNGESGLCSEEVSKFTSEEELNIGNPPVNLWKPQSES